MKKYVCLLSLALALAACNVRKSSPIAPSASQPAVASGPNVPAGTGFPSNGPELIAFIAARYPERLAGGISHEERILNMQFLRDRIIEAGKCGGMDLGWNMKRGGPEVSNDFIVERRDGGEFGHDIAIDYDNPSHPLELYWGDGSFPFYHEFPEPSCR